MASGGKAEPPVDAPDDPTAASADPTHVLTPAPAQFRANPVGYIIRLTTESAAFFAGSGWRAYQDYIGARILYPGLRAEVLEQVRARPKVRAMIEAAAKQQLEREKRRAAQRPDSKWAPCGRCKRVKTLDECMTAQWARLDAILDGMAASMDHAWTLRAVAVVVNNVLVRLFHQGIHVRSNEWARVRKAAVAAAQRGESLVFLPCHKSHVDYLVLSYVLYRLGIALPHIAAGDNLDIPVVGTCLRSGGAFFIRRSWTGDAFYGTAVAQYVEVLLSRGHNLECFVEGTRSRVGKLLSPKLGFLKIVADAVLSGRVSDVTFVPVSLGYDKIIETTTYVDELMGTPKAPESLASLFRSTQLLQFRWGRIDVRFAEPYSLRGFLDAEIARRRSANPAFDPATQVHDKSALLLTLGYRVLSDINAVSVVMATALVGTIVLTLRGRAIGRSELIRRVRWLRAEILAKNGRTTAESSSSLYLGALVDHSVAVMRDFIQTRADLVEPVYQPLRRFELAYYRNQVMHLFINESILAVAMYATLKRATQAANETVPFHQLSDDTAFLSQLLKAEFIFRPGGFERNMERTLVYLVDKAVLTVTPPPARVVSLHERERRLGRENYDFYCFLVWPFVETYWLAAVGIFVLVPHLVAARDTTGAAAQPAVKWIDERALVTTLQTLGRNLYAQGDMTYQESINKEILGNAIRRYEQLGILVASCGPRPPLGPVLPAPSPPPRSEAVLEHLNRTSSGAAGPHVAAAGAPTIALAAPQVLARPAPSQRWLTLGAAWAVPALLQPLFRSKAAARGQPPPLVGSDRMLDFVLADEPVPGIGDLFQTRLWSLVDSVGRFRREGKQRRDNYLAAERVLRVAAACEQDFYTSVVPSGPLAALAVSAAIVETDSSGNVVFRRSGTFSSPSKL